MPALPLVHLAGGHSDIRREIEMVSRVLSAANNCTSSPAWPQPGRQLSCWRIFAPRSQPRLADPALASPCPKTASLVFQDRTAPRVDSICCWASRVGRTAVCPRSWLLQKQPGAFLLQASDHQAARPLLGSEGVAILTQVQSVCSSLFPVGVSRVGSAHGLVA